MIHKDDFKTITLCADDFGIQSGISDSILKLARMQRISAMSCMSNMPDFNHSGYVARELLDQVSIGLHFNITEGHFLSNTQQPCFGLHELLIKSHLRTLKPALIANEFHAQLDQYMLVMGQLPDFIDGHQHVHQLPVIRAVILDIYEQRLRKSNTFVRSTAPVIGFSRVFVKEKIIALTGGTALSKVLKSKKIPHNSHFSGVYNFNPDSNYRQLFQKWIQSAPNHTLIMCHPGYVNDNTDVIALARSKEMDYFLSDTFLEDCSKYRVRLDPLPESP